MVEKDKYNFRWIVLAMACVVNALTWGVTYSVGILYSDWVRYFHASPGYISFIGGLPTAMSCLAGTFFVVSAECLLQLADIGRYNYT